MSYDPALEQVTYRSDKVERPTAGTATVDPLEFLARLVTHLPDPGQVMQRYYGWYASRTRGMRRRQGLEPSGTELLRRIFEVDPLRCPQCQGLMRIVAVITDPAVITWILAHRTRARDHPPVAASPAAPAALTHSDRGRSPPPVTPAP